jgi:hypothetical protein
MWEIVSNFFQNKRNRLMKYELSPFPLQKTKFSSLLA